MNDRLNDPGSCSCPHGSRSEGNGSAGPSELARLVEFWSRQVDDLVLHDPGGPTECVVRAGELLVTGGPDRSLPRVVDEITERLRRWIDRVEELEEPQVARLRLRPAERTRCVEIAADLAGGPSGRNTGDTNRYVAPNHVHVGCPIIFGTPILFGTGSEPAEAEPVPAPPTETWDPPVVVAVLDTGLDPHPWFASRPWLSEHGLSPEVLDSDGVDGQDPQAGHGTFVAGLVLRGAPGAVLRHQRVLSSLGLTDDLTVAAGLRRTRRTADRYGEHLGVVLLTSGCRTADDRCPPVLRRELVHCTTRGTVVVAAAGNFGAERPFWPAALPEVLAVAATASEPTEGPAELAPFSNRGPWVDAAAPGVDVVSSYVLLERDPEGTAPGTEHRRYGYARWSGTSFAAPQVAAAVATALHAGADPAEARRQAIARYPVPAPAVTGSFS